MRDWQFVGGRSRQHADSEFEVESRKVEDGRSRELLEELYITPVRY
jgi:hypothetical protein